MASSDTASSYDITKTNHIFKTPNYKDEPKPTDNVWVGISHVHLPTFWCPLCESWSIHPESLHHDCIGFLKQIRDKVQKAMYRDPNERYTRKKDWSYNNSDRDTDHKAKRHAPSDRASYQERRTRSWSRSFDRSTSHPRESDNNKTHLDWNKGWH
jgi:hypothetical protein